MFCHHHWQFNTVISQRKFWFFTVKRGQLLFITDMDTFFFFFFLQNMTAPDMGPSGVKPQELKIKI